MLCSDAPLKPYRGQSIIDPSSTRRKGFMRHWSWILTAMAIIALAVVIYPLVQTQKRLRLVQTELNRANEQVVQAKAGAAELERVVANLKTELDAATMARTELQGNLEEANSD